LTDLSTLMKTDPNAGIRTLLDRYGGLAYVTVRRVLKGFPDDDVEECVSDVFYYLYRHRRRLDFSDAAFKSYLIRTAEHKALDLLRKSARTPVPSEDVLWDETASDRSAEEEAIALLSHDELILRIRALGEPDATILLSKYWLGMTSAEIGERLDMKPNTVVQRTKRALKKIREAWKGEES
jgi:RNA polymerase sigma-70 factor (ECF subfamily)